MVNEKSINVGRCRNLLEKEPTDRIFIAVPETDAELIESGITETKKMAITFSEDTAKWLIGALRYELAGRPDDHTAEDYTDA